MDTTDDPPTKRKCVDYQKSFISDRVVDRMLVDDLLRLEIMDSVSVRMTSTVIEQIEERKRMFNEYLSPAK